MEIGISDFTGSKIALICDGQMLTILRDDKTTIPWPNMWGSWQVVERVLGKI
jgi:MutT/NUDIX family protein